MAINERLIDTEVAAAADNGGAGTGNQEEGLILHLDANDVDSYDGDGTVWYDITNHEYTPAVDPAENFNTVTYTGNETSQSITGVGFQPDLIWVKNRDTTNNHLLFDSIRGNNFLIPNDTFAEDTSSSNTMSSFDSDGFSISGGGGSLNNSSDNYVAWCLKAGGAPTATNTSQSTQAANSISIDGVLQPSGYTHATGVDNYPYKASVNTKSGFSICTWEANGTSKDRIPHFLGEKPEMLILKRTEQTSAWTIWHKDLSGDSYRLVFDTGAEANAPTIIEDITSGYFEIGSGIHAVQADWVSYAFTSKRGVSKVGSYVGTGASNKVYTGFEPSWIMVKRTTSAGAGWYIVDNKRDTNTNKNKYISANSNAAEATSGSSVTFNTDGFTFNGSSYNTSGQTHIYLAFAAEKATSLIDDTDLELHLDPASYSGSGTTWTADTGSDATVVASRYDEELGDSFDISTASESSVVIPSGHPLNDNSFTLEFWFKSTEDWNNSAYGHNFIFDGDSAGWRLMYYETLGWILQGPVYTGYFGNGTVVTNKWHHVSLTYTGGTTNFYLDGELIKTLSQTRYSSSLGAFNFGSTLANNPKPKALVGQIRMYSSALTAAEVMQNYRFTKNAYPNGKHATLTSATWASEGSFSFQNSQYATIPVEGFVGDNDQIKTITAWVKADTTTSRVFPYTISSSSNANNYFTFGMYNDNNVVYCSCRNGGSANQWQDQFTITPDTAWHHMAVTFDGTTRRLYWDGDLQTTTEDNRGSATSSSWITYGNVGSSPKAYIGRGRHVSSWYSDGKVSDVKFFDIALTDDEIEADFNKGQYGAN